MADAPPRSDRVGQREIVETPAARGRSEVAARDPRTREKTQTPGQVTNLAGH